MSMPVRIQWTAWLALSLMVSLGCNNSGTDTTASDDASPDGVVADAGDAGDASDQPAGRKAAAAVDDKHPKVVLQTSMGEITIELDAERAPATVTNFLNYVESGHYDQTIFHQVDDGYVVLGGGYTEGLVVKEGRYAIHNEADNGLKNKRGTVAMARSLDSIDSSVCEFFVNLNDNPQLDHKGDTPEEFGFCVFGKVVKGMDTLEKISGVEVQDNGEFEKVPVETVWLQSAHRAR